MKYINELNLGGNIIKNIVLESLSTDPTTPYAGQLYFNTTTHTIKYHNGTAWVSIYDFEGLNDRIENIETTLFDETDGLAVKVTNILELLNDEQNGLVKRVEDLETKIGTIDSALDGIIGS